MNRPQKSCGKGRSKSTGQACQHAGLSVRYKEATTFEVVAYSLVSGGAAIHAVGSPAEKLIDIIGLWAYRVLDLYLGCLSARGLVTAGLTKQNPLLGHN